MQTKRQTALITGASAGIGRELAKLLAADHDLILTARREAELQSLAAELPTKCLVIPADLADPAGVNKLLDALKDHTIDVFANNAGFGDLGPFTEADPAKLLNMIQVNVAAYTALLSGILPGMKARGRGRIMNVGSVAGFQPGPFMATYYATKAYVNSLSQALSSELAGTGVTVTCLCPGPTDTEFASVAGFAGKSDFSVGMRMTSREVAAAGLRAMMRGKPVAVPGWRNRLLIFLQRFLPRTVVIGTVKQMMAKRLKRGN